MSSNREERLYSDSKADDQRKVFERDRDRILYSQSFRRLAQVTQVVSASESHAFHNRLTHSLLVAQVARRLAEKLIRETPQDVIDQVGSVDADVIEAAALAHDLGHPPFGHAAEEELDKLAKDIGLRDGFEGNAQSFRILTRLANHRSQYPGLNLTRATLNAVLKYPWFRDNNPKTKQYRKYSVYDLDEKAFIFARPSKCKKQTAEANIMDFADDLTYRTLFMGRANTD